MMKTLPDDWKEIPMRRKQRRRRGGVSNKSFGSAEDQQPAEKKTKEEASPKEAKEKEPEAARPDKATKTLEAQLIDSKKKVDEVLMEKNRVTEEMSHLNDRLAQYIHRVKELEYAKCKCTDGSPSSPQLLRRELPEPAAVSLNIQEQESDQGGEEAMKIGTDCMRHNALFPGPITGSLFEMKREEFLAYANDKNVAENKWILEKLQ